MTRRMHTLALGGAILSLCAAAGVYLCGRTAWHPVYARLRGRRTVQEALALVAPAAEGRLRPYFEGARVAYPPRRVTLVGLKQERSLELWASGGEGSRLVRTYPILGLSGQAGPKLREGDRQVPEGVYRVEALNPNSCYHLSLRLDYPNDFDLARAREDGRQHPGSDIFIHGGRQSIGCLAMGDAAIEELFVLAARLPPPAVKVIIAPCDMRRKTEYTPAPNAAPWTKDLYGDIREALGEFAEHAPGAERPDLGDLQQQVVSLVAEKWYEVTPSECFRAETALQSVDVFEVRRADELLCNDPAHMADFESRKGNIAYLVSAVASAGWWKLTTKHLAVLRWKDGRLQALLHFAGGSNWKGVDYEIVNIGADTDRYALLVRDYGCGNACSQTRTHLFLFDPEASAFREAFNELTTYMPGCTGPVYDGGVFFLASGRGMKDLLVQNRVWPSPYSGKAKVFESVFRWDGQRYAGRLQLPPEALP